MEIREVPFSELLSAVVDNRGKTCPTADAGIPLIATNCIRNELLYPTYEKARFVSQNTYSTWFRGHPEPGDILFVNKATPGRVCLVPDPVDFCIAQDMVAVRADTGRVYPWFLFAALRSQVVQERIATMHVGTLIPHFKKGDFDKLLIPVPSRRTQEFIGDTYYELSAKIDLNRRMNETLEAIARALFKSWFVDFDPVRAKAEGRDPVPKPLAGLFPDSFEDSELGEIPKGWRAATIRDLANINARTLSRKDSLDVIDYIEIREVMRGDVFTITRYSRGEEPSRARRRLQHGDTVLSTVRPDRGAFFLCLHPADTLIASTGLAVITSKNGCWAFLHAALTQPEIGEELGHLADGGAYPAVRPEVIGGLQMVIPQDQRIVNEFERLGQPLFEKAARNRTEMISLTAIRDALLPKLISGELRVKDAERFVETRQHGKD